MIKLSQSSICNISLSVSRSLTIVENTPNRMVLKLYGQDMSPTCRSVYLTAAALGLDLEVIPLNVWKKEQFAESFLKINPQHTIPTLDDNGTIVWDSNAINIYLVSKYGKDDSLYPKDITTRAVINQRLFYSAGVVFNLARDHILNIARRKDISNKDIRNITKVYDFLEIFLKQNEWMCCNSVTIADFALFPNITNFLSRTPLNVEKYPKLLKWVENMKKLPYFHVVEKGMKDMDDFVTSLLKLKSPL